MSHATRSQGPGPGRGRGRGRSGIRLTIVAACAGLLTAGLPAFHEAAEAKPQKGLCGQIYGLPNQAPPVTSLPGYNLRKDSPPPQGALGVRTYRYENLKRSVSGLSLPPGMTEQQLRAKYGKTTKGKAEDSPERAYAAWNRNQTKKDKSKRWTGSFESWVNTQYIELEARRSGGEAYEGQVVRDFKLSGQDWKCQESLPGYPSRRYDAVNHKTRTLYEFKSGVGHDAKQLAVDKRVLADPRYRGYKIVYIHGQDPTPETKKALSRAGIVSYKHRATGIPQYKPGPHTARSDIFNPTGKPSRGAAADTFRGSGKTWKDAKNIEAARKNSPNAGARMRGPGGVDFTSLELRYVGKPVKGDGLNYAFKADELPDPDTNPGFGGEAKARLASDAFFTWLALTPEKFWVNLNPDQPDKIMDDKFASTDAGRVLLEADLRMKHDFYKAMDPKTDLGKRFWDSIAKTADGKPCLNGLRNWIEPQPAKVREQDGGIHILDAPLKLKSVGQKTVTDGPGTPICDPTEAQIKYNQRVVDRTIVPAVEKMINSAPQYADLRRVYTSRVAAEWIRQQDAKKATDFRSIINSDDVKRWQLRAPHTGWDKNELFKKYRKIYTEGEFQYELDVRGTVYTYIVGGVDFSKSPKRNISRARFDVETPKLPGTTQISRSALQTYRESGTTYLGGNTADNIDDGGGTRPTPTPAPTKPDDPTTPPPSHTPTPSTPAPTGGGQDKPNPPKDPGGDLADTGSDTPIGLIAGIAAALAATGAGLAWWMRRRRTSTTG